MISQIPNLKSQIPKILLSIGIWSLVIAVPVLAQSASPSANPIRDAVKEKVNAELDQIKKNVAKRAFVGNVTAKSDSTLTLTNLKNQPRTITVTADSVIKLTGGKDGTPADLNAGDWLIAMGETDSQNIMTAKRVVVIPKATPENRIPFFATVTKVTSSSLTAENIKKEEVTIKLTSDTDYTGKSKFSDLAVGSKIIVISRAGTTTNSFTALILHLLVP